MDDIDTAMKGGCNFPMGPFALLDLVGLDTSLAILDALYAEFRDPNYAAVPALRRMVAAGQLGRKTRQRLLHLLNRHTVPGQTCTTHVGELSRLTRHRVTLGGVPWSRSSRRRRGSSIPSVGRADGEDLVGVGADLEPGTLLAAYRAGLFPMPVDPTAPQRWLVVARPPGRHPARRAAGDPVAAPQPAPLRGADRHPVHRGRRRLRRPDAARAVDHRRRSSTPTRALHELGWAHSVEVVRRRRAGRRAVRRADRTVLRRRVDVPHGDRRLEGGAGGAGRLAERHGCGAARRPVGHRPPGVARRGRGPPRRVPRRGCTPPSDPEADGAGGPRTDPLRASPAGSAIRPAGGFRRPSPPGSGSPKGGPGSALLVVPWDVEASSGPDPRGLEDSAPTPTCRMTSSTAR